jgi:hypothetical protein
MEKIGMTIRLQLVKGLPGACSSTVKPWNHLTVQLERVSESDAGDPDLYGLFYDSSHSATVSHWCKAVVANDCVFFVHFSRL